jgi:hypothetical protein
MSDCDDDGQEIDQFDVSQPAGGSYPRFIDVSDRTVAKWDENLPVVANSLIRPTHGNGTGFVYLTSSNGQTGENEPAWPTTVGGTVIDGSVTWTAEVPPAAGQDGIASVVWSQVSPPDATLTLSAQSNTALVASVNIGGGTSGNTYTVLAKITMTSGALYPVKIIVAIL